MSRAPISTDTPWLSTRCLNKSRGINFLLLLSQALTPPVGRHRIILSKTQFLANRPAPFTKSIFYLEKEVRTLQLLVDLSCISLL